MRRRKRYTVRCTPTGAGKVVLRGMGVFHAIFGTVFAVIAVVEIIPMFGPIGVLFFAAGVFFAINGTLVAMGKNGLIGRAYQVETDEEAEQEYSDSDMFDLETSESPVLPNAEARLRQLEDLREKRLITAGEYEEKRKEILKEL